jgi:DNA-binding transcriptional regulator YiaG
MPTPGPDRVRCPRCHGKGEIAMWTGAHLRAIREARGLSLRALAEPAGVSHVFLSDVEHGRRSASPRALAAYGIVPSPLSPRDTEEGSR